jgi:hypothetical protein
MAVCRLAHSPGPHVGFRRRGLANGGKDCSGLGMVLPRHPCPETETRGVNDFKNAPGEGSGWRRPSGAVTVGGSAVAAVPAPSEAGRKSRQRDPGSPQIEAALIRLCL